MHGTRKFRKNFAGTHLYLLPENTSVAYLNHQAVIEHNEMQY